MLTSFNEAPNYYSSFKYGRWKQESR